MIYYEQCPHCKADIAFRLTSYMESGDICYDIDIDDLSEGEETVDSGIVYNADNNQCCSRCGKKLNIYVSENIEIEAE